MKGLLIFCMLLLVEPLWAARVDYVEVESKAMHRELGCVVVVPDAVKKDSERRFPVLYLLAGFSGDERTWVSRFPELRELVDRYEIIVACSHTGYSSWYVDSPVDATMKYETFVAKEFTSYVDAHYPTLKQPQMRAIAGLSMGGHGAWLVAIRHRDLFSAAGSMSGGMDLRPFVRKWEIAKRLGLKEEHPENWEKYSVINLVDSLQPNDLNLWMDCGTEDLFSEVNLRLHQKLLQRSIPHTYMTRQGGHNYPYWRTSLSHQMLFFHRHFVEAQGSEK